MQRSNLATSLRDAWHAVLELEVTDDSDFYEQGGDSLSAAEVAARVVEQYTDVPDLDIVVLTALLEEGRFGAVVDAACAELGLAAPDPA